MWTWKDSTDRITSTLQPSTANQPPSLTHIKLNVNKTSIIKKDLKITAMSVVHHASKIKMCWHRLGQCSVKHRCDGFSRGHMELLSSMSRTENADSAGRCSTYLLTHTDDIIMTILVTLNQRQSKVRDEEEENDVGGCGGGIGSPLGHSLQVHRDRLDSWVSRSHTCMSEI